MSKSKRSAPQKAAKPVVVKAHKKKPTNVADAGGINDAKKTRVMIYWSKPENHYLTDQLLSLIEDSPLWMSVFGFDKGTSGSAVATGKGKNNLKHCADIKASLVVGIELPEELPELEDGEIGDPQDLGIPLEALQ
ncbi:hypothetical protein M405DRAFT_844015, partial [Rhizopogon salebrosus TDB-379]